ncbi:DUF4012 domain-containing protein [Actinotalea sp. BY-33]|uniref:DUF4012 domain-containing protein n=1 Tax=Actinotalea soli TaxID=2819234 RepID=A0A939LU61_9CELL|nr:DUF4012 domain-containing protein [Actinotalea soli]MBO1752194.1 DUF4012 domain-containing protein [Actinotalea soli]
MSADPAPTPPETVAATRAEARRGGRRRRWPWVVLSVLVVLALAAGWLVWRGLQVVEALEGALPEVTAAQAELARGEVEAAAARVPEVRERSAVASAATADPVWVVASALPWVGTQLDAVTDVVAAFDRVAEGVLPELVEVGTAVSPGELEVVDGRIDLAPIVAAAPRLASAAAAADEARDLVDGIDTDQLVDPLADRVREVQGPVAEAADLLAVADELAQVVPPMLGTDGPRRYLVLALNPAELRTAGGIAGAGIVLEAEDGALALVEQIAGRDLPNLTEPVLPVTAEEEDVHGGRLGLTLQNLTMTPDFPRTAELAVELWASATGEQVDAVVAVDPVALSYLLGATGSVTEPTGEVLTADTVVEQLLFQAYLRHTDPAAADDFFAGAAAAVFSSLASADSDPAALVSALEQAVDERRLSLWSTRAQEQELLGGTTLGGGFLSGAADAAAGVFLDDATGSKLGYFLEADLEVLGTTCGTGDQAASLLLGLELRSTAPTDPAVIAALPPDVVGAGLTGVEPGTMRTNVTVYAPVGGSVGSVTRGGAVVGGDPGTSAGRELLMVTSTLAPGEAESFEIEVRLAPGETEAPVWATPSLTLTGLPATPTCP